jgi:hypothetical protein
MNFRDPLFQHGHGSTSTTGCAIVGAAFYNPPVNQFPSSYLGKYFFGDLCSGWIRVFDPARAWRAVLPPDSRPRSICTSVLTVVSTIWPRGTAGRSPGSCGGLATFTFPSARAWAPATMF